VAKVTGIETQKELAGLLGIEPAAISLAKSRGVPKSWGLKLAAQLGINPEWLQTGRGAVHQNDMGKTALVPKVSARACAGGGSLELGDNVIDELPFDRSWLSRKGNPARMVAMEVVGDSMSPELEPGDNILIDQSQNTVANDNLYVIGLGESIQVKRVQIRPGLVILFSTNQRYTPVTLQGDEIDTLRVVGRVLWSSRAYA
jgi:phage repressor protein C with HTH and peptisase S24 domain